MASRKKTNLDEELKKAKQSMEKRPPFSRKDYEDALKAMAKKHGVTVAEVERWFLNDGF